MSRMRKVRLSPRMLRMTSLALLVYTAWLTTTLLLGFSSTTLRISQHRAV